MNGYLPKTMHAIEITEPGPPNVLVPTLRPLPVLSEYDVLIRVVAAGVNRPDVLQRKGLYPAPPGTSDIPGLEVAGTIAMLGSKVGTWKIGAPVCALLNGGGYAEYAAAHHSLCLPIPKGLSPIEAASLPETAFTVWSNVFERAAIKPGETFLVHGGASGIGVMAIQMVHALGHRVFATAGSEEKCVACVHLGAEKAFNYKTEDFVRKIKENTSGRGVDVILDMVTGNYIARDLKALADDGRIAIIAYSGGSKASIDCGEILRRRLTISGSTLRGRSTEFKAEIAHTLKERIWPLIGSGAILAVVHATFPLNDAENAHTLMESGKHIGKLVLTLP